MNKGYRSILLLAFVAAGLIANAQEIPSPDNFKILQDRPMYNGTRQSELRLTGSGELGSNVLNAEFLMFRINDQVIDDNYPRINVYSRIGFTGSAGLQYTNCANFLKDSGLIWSVGISSAEHFGVEVSQDLLKLALRGNKQFAGREIEFGNSAFQYYAYDKVTFGLNGFRDDMEWKAGLSAIGGRDHYFAEIPTGNMKTSSLGDSITGAVYSNWDYSTGDQQYTGYGLGLDLSVAGEFGSNLFAKFSVTDLGFIQWNDMQQRTVNSKLDFEGFYYTFDRTKNAGLSLIDSISEQYLTEDSGSVFRTLPMRIRIDLNNMIVPNHFVGLSMDYIHLPGYEPVVAITHHWFISKHVALETNVGYGAFGSFRWKERVHLQFGEKLGVSVGIIGIEGLIMQDTPLNGGAFFEAAWFL